MKKTATTGFSRRIFLGAAITAAGLGLSGCAGGGSPAAGGNVELNFVYWGDANRAKMTDAAIKIFEEKNPGITIKSEYQDSGPYADKLATRFAGGNPPDVLNMANRSLLEYAQRGTLADLKELPELNLDKIPETVLSRGEVDGKLYGLATGVTTIGMVVNKAITDQAGVTIPDDKTWSWEDYAKFATEVTQKTGGKVYGAGYDVSTETGPILFARQRGEDFYTEDNKLGVSEDTIREWFQYSVDLRNAGGYPPAGFFEQIGGSAAQSYLAKGTVASQIIPINNYKAYNEAAGGNVVLLRMPGETTEKRRGYSADPSMLWSIAAKSKHPKEAAKFVDFLINDADGAAETLTQRGVPINPDVADAIKSKLGADDTKFVQLVADLQKDELPPAYVYPKGASVVADTLKQLATEVEFGRVTPADAAKTFLEKSNAAINK
ncbi:extracellular solute-binding protein family 1 [Pseudarthrobacter chlorophenolicus A6]|uniref:Extracellular solute-binding protein family 1 n=1 Tax=Pseudarthrobacter chlorophenolicus (strain ATCC 700700 / DSM 12829 / CIP 107037 / JCM 12360 / KCTC 9906 / NCIMB 13794 / A6) TaxID=452863 RepID=B8HAN7_PSECP|nr:ABC transporter substrate-binding protein [Pseudarthrobacter chlorophenolicus]ACL38498.1 extracellular solute-binding protein family 1 [Pseudarthrobacter chlorophenolicus A6]SDQ47542.1 carbohydrate ABC transporter substrate-binding protein, CUT1 family [Pseudarthrobacter chlorophenolicus]